MSSAAVPWWSSPRDMTAKTAVCNQTFISLLGVITATDPSLSNKRPSVSGTSPRRVISCCKWNGRKTKDVIIMIIQTQLITGLHWQQGWAVMVTWYSLQSSAECYLFLNYRYSLFCLVYRKEILEWVVYRRSWEAIENRTPCVFYAYWFLCWLCS